METKHFLLLIFLVLFCFNGSWLIADESDTARTFSRPQSDDNPHDPILRFNPTSNTSSSIADIYVSQISQDTTEEGDKAHFNIHLLTAPVENIFIGIVSKNEREGKASPNEIIFTPENWNKNQIITIVGQDDEIADGDQRYDVIISIVKGDFNYSRMKPKTVQVVNRDNDKSGIVVGSLNGSVSESGEAATFTVRLRTKPTQPVHIPIASSNLSEAQVSSSLLVFLKSNWQQNQIVTVTGQDDFVLDGPQSFQIQIGPSKSEDKQYRGLTPKSLKTVNREKSEPALNMKLKMRSQVHSSDPDRQSGFGLEEDMGLIKEINKARKRPAIIVSSMKGDITEAGGSARFSIHLQTKPYKAVPVIITSEDKTEADVQPKQLIFNPKNWNEEQVVTVVGQDDFIADNDQTFTIKITTDPEADYQYARLEPKILSGVNKDNDKAGFLVGKVSGPTTEEGEAATFSVKLLTKPLAPVTLYLASNMQKEGRVMHGKRVFTGKNWNHDQLVTVVGQNDFIADKDASYHIISRKTVSQDTGYNNLEFPKVSVTNKSAVNTVANVKLSAGLDTTPKISANALGVKIPSIQKPGSSSRLVREIQQKAQKANVIVGAVDKHTSESGRSAGFSVHLSVKPTVDVIVYLESKNKNEGKVKTERLIFTSKNWDKKQSVTVVGQDDKIADGNTTYDIEIRPTSDGDFRYSRLAPIMKQVVNKDNDLAGFNIKKTGGITTENGKTATFAISLKSEPTAQVIIPVFSSDLKEGVLNISKLEFNPKNWDQEQVVTVTGQDDQIADGRKSYYVILNNIISQDTRYHSLNPPNVQFFNEDNDSAGLVHSKIKKSTREDGQVVSFMIRLNTQPIDTVLLSLSSTDSGEGIPDPRQIRFTSENWRKTQKVKITGQDDAVNDGDQTYFIQLSTQKSRDKVYRSLTPVKVAVINEDNDIASIHVGKPAGRISEDGEQAVFALRLTSEPATDVTLSVESLNPTEGEVLNKSAVFNGSNWKKEQLISVVGVDDVFADGDQPFKVQISVEKSKDARYQLSDPVFLDLVNRDNDKAGFIIGKISGNTSEDGDPATFTMTLSSKPTSNVTVKLSSNDKTEGSTEKTALIFTPTNWNIKQIVTVTGVNDQLVDGKQRFAIVTSPASSLDADYNQLDADDIFIVNLDNNLTTFFVSSIRGKTTENGRKERLIVHLKSQPKSKVTINITSSDLSEGATAPSSLTFNPGNWDQEQKVVVSGIDDNIHDGDQAYQVVFTASSEDEPAYNNIPPVIRHLRNLDDDKAGISVRVIDEISNEQGKIAEFAIRLNSQPISAVVLLFASSNPKEGKLLTKQASFNEKSWKEEQIIRIQGVADNRVDNNQEYKIGSAGGISSDPNYNKVPFPEINLINRNMDEANFVVSEISGNTSEIGNTANFTVHLNSKPDYEVTINLKSSNLNEGFIDTSKLKFDRKNWNIPQTITITGVDDFVKDEDQNYSIIFSSSVSDDGKYHGLMPPAVRLKNLDNKQLTIGSRIFYMLLTGDLNEDFDSTFSLGITGGYVYNKNLCFDFMLLQMVLKGSPVKMLYGSYHKMEHSLEFTSLLAGGKYTFFKTPVAFFVKPGLGLHQWKYQSTTFTDGTTYGNNGVDLEVSLSTGIDITVLGNLFIDVSMGQHILTGALGGSQFTMFSAGINYPF